MPDIRRLLIFVETAPAGTLVPVESLREMLTVERSVAQDGERMLTPTEAAEWLHRQIGGRKRSAAAVRKVMRTGFRGVVLKSYPYGRERRTTEADLRHFVAQIGAVPRIFTSSVVETAAPSSENGFQVESAADPADEIAAAQERFRRSQRRPPMQRRASSGT